MISTRWESLRPSCQYGVYCAYLDQGVTQSHSCPGWQSRFYRPSLRETISLVGLPGRIDSFFSVCTFVVPALQAANMGVLQVRSRTM